MIFVVLDDIGIEYLDYHGLGEQYAEGQDLRESPDPGIPWEYFNTPRLSAIAHRGVWFDNFFATSLCSTSRVRLHTGKRLDQIGVGTNIRTPNSATSPTSWPVTGYKLDDDLTFLAAHLRSMLPNLDTGHFGKWHMCDPWSTVGDGGAAHTPDVNLADPTRLGFQTSNWGPLPYGSRYQFWHITDGVPAWIDGQTGSNFVEATHSGSVMANAACTWLAARTRPFACSISLEFTHMPLDVPPFTLLSDATQASLTELGLEPGDRLVGLPNFEDPRVDDDFWPQLYANAEAMDTIIGRIEDSIPAALKPRTYIVVVGDNGGHVGVTPPGFPLHGKDSLTRGGTQVTCVVSGPRVARPDRSVKQICDIGDLYATICELMGCPSGNVDSTSMVPALVDTVDREDARALKPYSIEQSFFPMGETNPANMNTRRRSIVDGSFRYLDDNGTHEVYDLRVDPIEENEIMASLNTEQAAAVAVLQETLDEILPTS